MKEKQAGSGDQISQSLTGVGRIAAERERQVYEEKWSPRHDDNHDDETLAMAAACYAAPVPIRAKFGVLPNCGCREAHCPHTSVFPGKGQWRDPWPWDESSDKRKKHGRLRQLEIAGALIAAEIDRLLRKEPKQAAEPSPTRTAEPSLPEAAKVFQDLHTGKTEIWPPRKAESLPPPEVKDGDLQG